MKWKLTIRLALLVGLAFFSFLMIRLTLPYRAMQPDIAFLRSKQHIYHVKHWRFSFYTHVFTSCLVLLAGFTQFSSWLLRRRPRIHRTMGWTYLVTVCLVSGPAAFVMALYANGGWLARTSFTTLATLWIGFTFLAGYYVMRKRFVLHGSFMIRSYALTLSAITLRSYTYLLEQTTWNITPREIYILTAWLSWVPNLLVAEWLIRRSRRAERMIGAGGLGIIETPPAN